MSNNNQSWPSLLLGGLVTVAAITSAGYIYNKLQTEDAVPIEQGMREEDETEAEVKRQELKGKAEVLSRIKKMSLIAKLENLIKELELKSRTRNFALMKKPIDEIQQTIQEEPSFRDGVYDPDVILLLSNMYAIISDNTQQRKCLEKCAEKFSLNSKEYMITCQRLVNVCVVLGDYEGSNKWAGCNLEAWKAVVGKADAPKNYFDLANSHASYAITLMRVGRFKDSIENFKEALAIYKQFSPVHDMCLSTLKNYLATILASGDITNARMEADLYLLQLEESEGPVGNKLLKKQYREFILEVYHIFGCLLRDIEQFDFAAEYLERGENYAREKLMHVPLQLLVDSANIFWELENSEKASEKEKQVRDFKIHDGFKALVPLSRSKYLLSTFAVLLENCYYLKVQLVPRSEAARKEGIPIAISEAIPRLSFKEKLTLNVTFENTEGGTFDQQFFLAEGEKQLVIQSKAMNQKAEIYQFYKVVIQISDEEGTSLGMHHQLVLSPNPADVDADALSDY